jgi:transglutaminase-like putative cysteine protease
MRLHIRHRSAYRQIESALRVTEMLRLSPFPWDGLTVARWSVRDAEGAELPFFRDGFGNLVHCHSFGGDRGDASLVIEGEVETANSWGVVRGAAETLPPVFYLRETKLTSPDAELTALAHSAALPGKPVLKWLHTLLSLVGDRLETRSAVTTEETGAAEALRGGAGTARDHAHVFITASRLLGIPARFVSGYLWTGEETRDYQALHAWVEAYVHDLGWVGFDPPNRICPTEAYIRAAIGLDARSAAPVRSSQRRNSERVAIELRAIQSKAEQQ